ncbi:TPA: trypsin-like peptidase domain-containing protein [Streptococcus suis]|uniref:S1C family serine protease n=1 Tax=Streptococcus parasuis TaxID=1501662 RepID=UPI00158201F9|nr:trypsin-like peptidase domain-containing protein [Streptococcus parasuis]HEM3598378.1 trypsin-like peptidase domain-containing protein [Streptococcus suis]QWV85780.1 trypsin-like peptidase domain-containing protein [Streptococcus parasuis]HEM3608454.1 trypsin-like peptidase domain-containing protein [Streptococcus suis]HEM3609650.1 trypsin-like peptidase domain-containing protein [Streptococcus suis]HEM3615910.1 trypsin-like peptidase domain-containing protein [Streptococcus suis]
MKKLLKFVILFVVGFLGGIGGYYFASSTLTQGNSTSNQANTTSVSNVQYTNDTSTTQAVEKVQDAVVSVINYQTQSSNSLSSIFGNIESSDELAVAGEGSGVIYKKDGDTAYIVTNNHVISGAEKIDILLASGEKLSGELVGADTYSDIAVIKIAADKVTTIAEFANSDTIKVGETAIAIGSPLGSVYANTVTQGIISSLSRTVTSQTEDGQTISTNAIQTDTAINPGNSGGPLINIQGQVIGINSSKITSSSVSSSGVAVEGMGFAIPSNDTVQIINQLETNGKVTRPALGVQMVNLTDLSTSQLEKAGLANTDLTSGVLIVSTQSGLPADGKFEPYDVIIEIDGETIENKSDLQSELYKHQIGDTITVSYYRNNKKMTVDIKLTHSTDDLS